jgi:hypothetical protein
VNKIPEEKGNTLKQQVYADLEQLLEATENTLYRIYKEDGMLYVPARCPKCHGLLGQMCGSANQICLKCGTEWELKEYTPPSAKK